MPATSFRLLVVPGVIVDKWGRVWAERQPDVPLELIPVAAAGADGLLPGDADAGLLRLPVDREVLHAIPLYTETTVVMAPRDHLLAAGDEVDLADLADEVRLHPADDVLAPPAPDGPASTAAAVELVAAGVGVLVVPLSLARAHQRRDVIHRPVRDAPTSSVGLVWPRDGHSELVETMIGVVRGRTANSTRGGTPPPRERRHRPR